MLAHAGIAFEARDIFKQPLSEGELRRLLGHTTIDDLFSWRSPTARARGLHPGGLTEDEAVRLMATEPRLVRRPLILVANRLIIGANRDAIDSLG